jgi:hypothetical protein
MRRSSRKVKAVARPQLERLAVDLEVNLALQNPHALILAMTMGRVVSAGNVVPSEGVKTFAMQPGLGLILGETFR